MPVVILALALITQIVLPAQSVFQMLKVCAIVTGIKNTPNLLMTALLNLNPALTQIVKHALVLCSLTVHPVRLPISSSLILFNV